MSFVIWEGIHSSFQEVSTRGAGFLSQTWLDRSLAGLQALRAPEVTAVPQAVTYSSTLLHAVAALALTEKPQLKILDFGGGLGLTYASLLKATNNPEQLQFHIVENSEVCAEGRRAFTDDSRVCFHDVLPELKDVDIVHAQSSLQYVDDWRGLLNRLVAYRARWMVLTDVPAGEFPTYASSQNYYGSCIPCWFFNTDEFITALNDVGGGGVPCDS